MLYCFCTERAWSNLTITVRESGNQFQRIQSSAELTQWLFTTIRHYSRMCATVPTICTIRAIRDHPLFAIWAFHTPQQQLLHSRLEQQDWLSGLNTSWGWCGAREALVWHRIANGHFCEMNWSSELKETGFKISWRKLNEAFKHDKIAMAINSSSIIKNIVTYIFLQEENVFHR